MVSESPLSIRPATIEDLPAIVAMRDKLNALELIGSPHAPIQKLSVDEFTVLWGESFQDPNHCWLLMDAGITPVGFGLIYLLPKSRPLGAYIHWTYLEAEHRRNGDGQALVRELIAWATSKGARRVELQFIEGNDIARQFWTKLGFQPYARKCVYYPT